MARNRRISRRKVVGGTTAIVGFTATHVGSAIFNDAYGCHNYVSPVDGLKGCGAYRRDGATGTPSPPPPPPSTDQNSSSSCNSTPTEASSPPVAPPPSPPPSSVTPAGPDPLRTAFVSQQRFALIWSKCDASAPYGPESLGGREGFVSVRDRFTAAFYVPPQQHAAGAGLTYNLSDGYDFRSEAKNAINVFRKLRSRSKLTSSNVMSFNVEGGNSEAATYEWSESQAERSRSIDWMRRYAVALRAEASNQGLSSLSLSNYNLPRLNGITSLRRNGIGTIAQRIANDFNNLNGTWSSFGPFAYCYPASFGVNSEAKQREWTKLYVDFYGELSNRLPREAGWVPWLWPYLWQYGVNKWSSWSGNFYNHFLYPDVVYDFLNDLKRAGASGVNFWTETCDRTQPGGSSVDSNKLEAWHQIGLAVGQFARENNIIRINA